MAVHVVPSGEVNEVIVVPRRVSLTHSGPWPEALVAVVVPPATVRRWNTRGLLAATSIAAFAASSASVARIMTPAFDQGCASSTDRTRATTSKSPEIERYT